MKKLLVALALLTSTLAFAQTEKISQLPVGSAIQGNELIPIVQPPVSGQTVTTTPFTLKSYIDSTLIIGSPVSGNCVKWASPLTLEDAGAACGSGGGGGSGTVTYVGLSMPSWLTVTGSPITSSGTFNVTATGQVPVANGGTGSFSLSGASIPQFIGGIVSGDCVKWASSVTIEDAGQACGTGNGTVTSVNLSVPSWLTVSGNPITTSGTLAISANGAIPVVNGGSGATTLTGPIKGNGTSAFSAAAYSDIVGLFSGCSGTAYLGADGNCHTAGSGTGTVSYVGLTVPSWLSVSGSPITSSGTLAITATGQVPVANGGTGVSTSTGSGSVVLSTSPTLVTPVLGVATATSINGSTVPTSAGTLPGTTGSFTSNDCVKVNSVSPLVLADYGTTCGSGSGTVNSGTAGQVAYYASTGTAVSGLATTGSGVAVLATSPTLVTPNIGTPSAGVATNLTGLPLTTGVTGVLPVANGGSGVTTSTGSGSNVLNTSPTLVTPVLGTPTSVTLTNATGLPLSTGVTGTLQAAQFPALTGDCTTTAGSLATTCTKTSGTSFGTFATQNYATPPAIGGTTPAAGAFTTLSASSTVSGTGFSAYFASPPAIGGTTPAAGSFTTGSFTGNLTTNVTGVTQCLQASSAGVISGTGSGCSASPSFSSISSGTNTTATMTVGTGGTLTYSGTGVVNASELVGAAPPISAAVTATNGSGQLIPLTLSSGLTINSGVLGPTVVPNAQTGTSYAMLTTDGGKTLTFSNASATAVSLSAATTTGFTTGYGFTLQNKGVGTVTLTPATSTVNGAATLVVPTNTGCDVWSDGTNYQVNSCDALAAAYVLTNATGLPISTGVSGLGTGIATFLGTPTSANLASALTNETGTGLVVFNTSPQLTTPELLGSSTGYTTFASANASTTNYTATFPAATDTVVELTQTQTLTNKSIAASEVNSGVLAAAQLPPTVPTDGLAIGSGTSMTPSCAYEDNYTTLTATAGTFTINAPTGCTAAEGQKLLIHVKSTNVQTYSWNSAYVGGATALPTSSSGSSLGDWLGFRYDSFNSKWDYVASATGF